MTSNLHIQKDDPGRPEIAALLREHLREMQIHSPPASVHAIDVDQLNATDLTFWSAWYDTRLAGCGALKQLDARHGEIKSMRTAVNYLRQGVATALLEHILKEARERGYTRVSLETGSMEAFAPAQTLYSRFGFTQCAPFANYINDPHSIYMTLAL